jgi:hypothetical protein
MQDEVRLANREVGRVHHVHRISNCRKSLSACILDLRGDAGR